jgi:hypothetical protein
VSYDIAWKSGSRSDTVNTTDNFFVIEELDACVTFEVSVTVNCIELAVLNTTNVTTLSDGKWLVMCRFIACACTTSY